MINSRYNEDLKKNDTQNCGLIYGYHMGQIRKVYKNNNKISIQITINDQFNIFKNYNIKSKKAEYEFIKDMKKYFDLEPNSLTPNFMNSYLMGRKVYIYTWFCQNLFRQINLMTEDEFKHFQRKNGQKSTACCE